MAQLATDLDRIGVDYRILGGLAVHTHGWRRNTEDVDLLVSAEGYRQILEQLRGQGYLPKLRGSKHLRNTRTRVDVECLIAGQDRPGTDQAPICFPEPRTVPAVPATVAPSAKVVDLRTLIELKLFSYRYSEARTADLGDVEELVKRADLPRELADALHVDVSDLYRQTWERVQRYRADPGSADQLGEAVSPYFNEVAVLLERGEITPDEAILRLNRE